MNVITCRHFALSSGDVEEGRGALPDDWPFDRARRYRWCMKNDCSCPYNPQNHPNCEIYAPSEEIVLGTCSDSSGGRWLLCIARIGLGLPGLIVRNSDGKVLRQLEVKEVIDIEQAWRIFVDVCHEQFQQLPQRSKLTPKQSNSGLLRQLIGQQLPTS